MIFIDCLRLKAPGSTPHRYVLNAYSLFSSVFDASGGLHAVCLVSVGMLLMHLMRSDSSGRLQAHHFYCIFLWILDAEDDSGQVFI